MLEEPSAARRAGVAMGAPAAVVCMAFWPQPTRARRTRAAGRMESRGIGTSCVRECIGLGMRLAARVGRFTTGLWEGYDFWVAGDWRRLTVERCGRPLIAPSAAQ